WGGVSPITPDHVNPEAPWPHLDHLAEETAKAGKILTERLTVYPRYVEARADWIAPALHKSVLRLSDGAGLARVGGFAPGAPDALHTDDLTDVAARPLLRASDAILRIVDKAGLGRGLNEDEIVTLFAARGADFTEICRTADRLRKETVGDAVSYVV